MEFTCRCKNRNEKKNFPSTYTEQAVFVGGKKVGMIAQCIICKETILYAQRDMDGAVPLWVKAIYGMTPTPYRDIYVYAAPIAKPKKAADGN